MFVDQKRSGGLGELEIRGPKSRHVPPVLRLGNPNAVYSFFAQAFAETGYPVLEKRRFHTFFSFRRDFPLFYQSVSRNAIFHIPVLSARVGRWTGVSGGA